jgi:16S rRNA (guanine966-N2)-methyltransferase
MRIIAGSAGRLRLEVPTGELLRPTQDKVRAAIFSSLQPRLAGARVLDVFAGTGAIGLEAVSRGAEHCVFVEKHPRCVEAIRKNIAHCRLQERTVVAPADVFDFLRKAREKGECFDLVFADPPYLKAESPQEVDAFYSRLCTAVAGCLDEEGMAVVGFFVPRAPRVFGPLFVLREKRYGQTGLVFLAPARNGGCRSMEEARDDQESRKSRKKHEQCDART